MGISDAGRRSICAAVSDHHPTGGSRREYPPRGLGADNSLERAEPTGKRHTPDAAVFPRSQAPRARTLIDAVWETIATYAESPAIDDGTVRLTYGALGSRMKALAQRLWVLGIGAGDRVGVRAQSGSTDLYIAILGIMACGAAYVPVDIDEPNERMATVWSEARVCAMIGGILKSAWSQYAGRRAIVESRIQRTTRGSFLRPDQPANRKGSPLRTGPLRRGPMRRLKCIAGEIGWALATESLPGCP